MRVVMVMYMRERPADEIILNPAPAVCIALLLAAAGTLLLGIFPGPILEFARAESAGIVG